MKRESRALVFISPETNAPIEHYRSSDQSSSSAASEDGVISTKSPLSHSMDALLNPSMKTGGGGGIPELPVHSKLHRWMETPSMHEVSMTSHRQLFDNGLIPVKESSSSVANMSNEGGGGGLGLYFYGLPNIWSQNIIVPSLNPILPNYYSMNPTNIELDDMNFSCALNNETLDTTADVESLMRIGGSHDNNCYTTAAVQQSGTVPKSSRLWTWMADYHS
eukprot:g2645.t1